MSQGKDAVYPVVNGKNTKLLVSVGFCITASWFMYKYLSKKTLKTETHVSSPSHNSLIPFTVKQSNKVTVHNGNKFASVDYEIIAKDTQLQRSRDFFTFMNMRRSFRQFSDDTVDIEVIRNCIAAANTAPSGAHCSPWIFLLVTNPAKRMKIREMVEREEQINYDRRMKQTWIDALNPIVSNLHSFDAIEKPYLTAAPYLVVVMKEMYKMDEETGNKIENYYPNQSTGIAVGMFITALHNANLVTLPSTPMGAEKRIREICGRNQNEKVFLLCPVGYPDKHATIPYRTKVNWRKDLSKAMVIV